MNPRMIRFISYTVEHLHYRNSVILSDALTLVRVTRRRIEVGAQNDDGLELRIDFPAGLSVHRQERWFALLHYRRDSLLYVLVRK